MMPFFTSCEVVAGGKSKNMQESGHTICSAGSIRSFKTKRVDALAKSLVWLMFLDQKRICRRVK